MIKKTFHITEISNRHLREASFKTGLPQNYHVDRALAQYFKRHPDLLVDAPEKVAKMTTDRPIQS